MRMRGIVVAVVGLAIALGTTTCKKTQEGETKNWDRNNRRIEELIALYPGFAPAIRTQLAQAQAGMDAAKGISNAQESARKMSESNSMLSGGFIGSLGDVANKVKKIREKVMTASSFAPAGTDQLAARTVVADAQRVLMAVDESLRRGAADPVAATAVLRRVDSDLSDAARNLDRFIDASKKQQEAAKGTPAAAPAAALGAAGAEAPKAVAAQWKCKYCGKMQEDSARKCKSCGASR